MNLGSALQFFTENEPPDALTAFILTVTYESDALVSSFY